MRWVFETSNGGLVRRYTGSISGFPVEKGLNQISISVYRRIVLIPSKEGFRLDSLATNHHELNCTPNQIGSSAAKHCSCTEGGGGWIDGGSVDEGDL